MQIIVSAVGDISFQGRNADRPSGRVFSQVKRHLQKSGLTVANLESPLVEEGVGVIGKATLRGAPGWAKILKEAGIKVISLANNHMMDYGEGGLRSTIEAVKEAGLKFVGAGENRLEACAPAFIDVERTRVAFLGRSAVIVSSPSYAGETQPGVAFLNMEETMKNIEACREEADFVILLVHWGLEGYSYPSPQQRHLARVLIETKADVILGHHPHVLQGYEQIGRGLALYSLGNFLFHDFKWSFVDNEGLAHVSEIKMTVENRKSGIAEICLENGVAKLLSFVPTAIRNDGIAMEDHSEERIREFKYLCSMFHWPVYSAFWRLNSLKQEWNLRLKPLTIGRLKWNSLKKIRPKHFRELYNGIRRSGKITSEKSMNPYE